MRFECEEDFMFRHNIKSKLKFKAQILKKKIKNEFFQDKSFSIPSIQ